MASEQTEILRCSSVSSSSSPPWSPASTSEAPRIRLTSKVKASELANTSLDEVE
eukprot:CAMPEP_0194063388 /NCGR_PEP_ID=MMETSP0009_2-20130614/80164_1 /TAXON_ID=210454 /ORGANISM="Grammatophora oceanica, Strain CCMP 410" /LENGTH=53 /DNA_ID=CAMNT_0038715485 /DNA_START=121 /DNA_END=282 /DNA_ORIENTATION=-